VRKTTKIVNLATSLGALVAPVVAPEIANATDSDSDEAHIDKASEAKPEVKQLPRGTDLMSFTVHQTSDGMMVPQHGSHASHASHSSHVSHASSSGSYGSDDDDSGY
jgi:hypothetical protein